MVPLFEDGAIIRWDTAASIIVTIYRDRERNTVSFLLWEQRSLMQLYPLIFLPVSYCLLHKIITGYNTCWTHFLKPFQICFVSWEHSFFEETQTCSWFMLGNYRLLDAEEIFMVKRTCYVLHGFSETNHCSKEFSDASHPSNIYTVRPGVEQYSGSKVQYELFSSALTKAKAELEAFFSLKLTLFTRRSCVSYVHLDYSQL